MSGLVIAGAAAGDALDEDGAAAGKPANQAATLAQSFGFQFRLLGPVVIVGVDKNTAEPAALSPAQAGAILERVREPPA